MRVAEKQLNGAGNGQRRMRWGVQAMQFLCVVSGALTLAFIFIKGDGLDAPNSHAEAIQSINNDAMLSDLQGMAMVLSLVQSKGGAEPDDVERFAEYQQRTMTRLQTLRINVQAASADPDAVRLVASSHQAMQLAETAWATSIGERPRTILALYLAIEAVQGDLRERFRSHWLEQKQLKVLQEQDDRRLKAWVTAAMVLLTGISFGVILILRRESSADLDRQNAEAKALFLAYYDPLTEIANRTHFQEELSARLEAGEQVTLLLFDLDAFKAINDTHGHAAGDAVLACFAARLNGVLTGRGGMAARLGGDEFAAILPSENEQCIGEVCDQLLMLMPKPIPFEGIEIIARVSIGYASASTIEPQADRNAALVSAADFALYSAKADGRGVSRSFDTELADRQRAQKVVLSALPAALENKEFFVAYQPKVTLKSDRVYGFEALVRWYHNGRVVPPFEFVPIAEQSSLILDIDLWVLQTATQQVALWNLETGANLSISVNLSTRHFRSDKIVSDVSAALEASGLEPWLLTLEITETVLIEDWQKVRALLADLKALGVLISLDDFGTGYSSIAYLRKICADELKIDRSFIVDVERSEETRFLLDAIVDMAHTMHMTIVAEGLETEKQAKIVADFGVNNGQGYLWSKPIPAAEIETLFLPGLTTAEAEADAEQERF